jgi:hypothetical protein
MRVGLGSVAVFEHGEGKSWQWVGGFAAWAAPPKHASNYHGGDTPGHGLSGVFVLTVPAEHVTAGKPRGVGPLPSRAKRPLRRSRRTRRAHSA